jgi:hypothetical protein
MSVFFGVELTAAVERAEADFLVRAAGRGSVTELGGGVAVCLPPPSPLSKLAGLGFAALPTAEELDAVEAVFAQAGVPVKAEVASLADPAVGELLTGRGYRLQGHHHVLGRDLRQPPEPVPGIEVRLVDASDEESITGWIRLAAQGGTVPEGQGVAARERNGVEVVEQVLRDLAAAGRRHYLALRDGVAAGAASMRLAGEIAQFTGASTLPEHRRRGVQAALLATRLADAAASGAQVAVLTTRPGSKSQENAVRQGFSVQYTRSLLVLDRLR